MLRERRSPANLEPTFVSFLAYRVAKNVVMVKTRFLCHTLPRSFHGLVVVNRNCDVLASQRSSFECCLYQACTPMASSMRL